MERIDFRPDSSSISPVGGAHDFAKHHPFSPFSPPAVRHPVYGRQMDPTAQQLQDLTERLDALEAENRVLRNQVEAQPAATTTTMISRRRLMLGGGAAALGADGIGEGVVWRGSHPIGGRMWFKVKGSKHRAA